MKKILVFAAFAAVVLACKPEIIPEVTVSTPSESLVVPSAGGSVTLTFDTNVEWTASLKETAASSWCTITPASGSAGTCSVKIVALENKEYDARTATVVITAGSVTDEAVITQLQKDAVQMAGEKTFNVTADGGEVRFAVSHNISFETSADVDWLTDAATKAMQDSEVVFIAAPNKGDERVGKITVSSTAGSDVITVTQAAFVPEFKVEPEGDIWLATKGGEASLTITANVEYSVTPDPDAKADWLTITQEKGKCTFKAIANESYAVRSVLVSLVPVEKKYEEMAKAIYVFQNGRATAMWHKNPASLDGYNTAKNARLAFYGGAIVLANTNKAFLLNPKDGAVAGSFDIPGFEANSACVDDAGNIILANDAFYGGTVGVYTIADPAKPSPVKLTEWNTANYYGYNAGNLRVKGNIKKDAVMALTVSGGAGGAVILWQIENGVCSDWKWVNVPYEVSEVKYGCALPLGTKISDGLLYAGYGGDYNIKYLASPALNSSANAWVTSYVTGYSWMENVNCLATCEHNGKKYAAFTAGCHFNYDDAEAILLDITDPAKAEFIYSYSASYDVERDDKWQNLQFTAAGTFSDILLASTKEGLIMAYVDSNFGSMACVVLN